MDVYTELHCICRDLMKKAKYLDAFGAKEGRRMIIQRSGIKRSKPRREYTSFRVKSTWNEKCVGRARGCARLQKPAEADEIIVAIVPDVTRVVPEYMGVVQDGTDLVPDGTTRQWAITEKKEWCRTARATRLNVIFLFLRFNYFHIRYYFVLDRFLPFPINKTLGHWE